MLCITNAFFGALSSEGTSHWVSLGWMATGTSPDLVSVIRLAVRNLARLENKNRLMSLFSRKIDAVRHRLRGNSITRSRRNIQAHYDLSNEFFNLFLDRNMMYSCALL